MQNDFSPIGDDETRDLSSEDRLLYDMLHDAGAAWRTGTPEVTALGDRLADRARMLSAASPSNVRSPHQQDCPTTVEGVPYQTRGSTTMTHQPYGRLRGAIAAFAAIAVVAAFTGVFMTMTRAHVSPGSSPSTASARKDQWVDLTRLDNAAEFGSNDLPAIAPSDPQVVYETFAYNEQQHKAATLRRTDDGGATWHALPTPVRADEIGAAGMAASPLDAHTVYLTLYVNSAADCPSNRVQPPGEGGASYVLCWLQYRSTDGGAHWAPLDLPSANGVPGVLNLDGTSGGGAPLLNGSLHAQGSRLYAGFNCAGAQNVVCQRLVSSTDGGAHWQFVDADLMAGATRICDALPAPTGSTVLAVTSPSDCGSSKQATLTFWRSADAGAHWTRVGTMPTPNEIGMRTGSDANGNTLVYAELPRTTSLATDKMGGKYPIYSSSLADVEVSVDAGVTWQHAPTAGIPSGFKPDFTFGPLGPLSDGSIVVPVIPQSVPDNVTGDNPYGVTLYAWKPGDTAWRQIAPKNYGETSALLVTPSSDGSNSTLYLVVVNRSGSGNTFTFLEDQL
jgi:hypothetical protein